MYVDCFNISKGPDVFLWWFLGNEVPSIQASRLLGTHRVSVRRSCQPHPPGCLHSKSCTVVSVVSQLDLCGPQNTDFSLQYLFHLLWGEYIVLFGIWLQQISTSFITRNRAKPISFQVWTQQLGPPTSTYNMHPCGMLPCRWLASLVASWKPKTGCQHPFPSWLSAHESYMKIHEVTVPWGMPSSGWHPCTETAASRLFGAFRSHSITDEWLWWDVYLS